MPRLDEKINDLMARLSDACMERPSLAHLLKEAHFLATLAGDSSITLVYACPVDDSWQRDARWLSHQLNCRIIGKYYYHFQGPEKVRVDRDVVLEQLFVNGRCLSYWQMANSFSQPNPGAASCMLSWADEVTSSIDGSADAHIVGD